MSNAMRTITTIELGHEELLVLDAGRRGRLRVLRGAAWLTEEGETDDTVLCAGNEHILHGGRALIEGLGPARVQFEMAPASGLRRLAARLRSIRHQVQAAVERLQLGPAPSL